MPVPIDDRYFDVSDICAAFNIPNELLQSDVSIAISQLATARKRMNEVTEDAEFEIIEPKQLSDG